MKYALDFDRIRDFTTDKNNKYSFERRKYVRVLPLPSRTGDRAEYKEGFATVSAAILRLIDHEELEFAQEEDFYQGILDSGDFDSEETKKMFMEFLEFELGNADESNTSSIQGLKYIAQPDSKAEKKGQTQIIEFFYDIYIRDQHEEIEQIVSELHGKGLMHDILNVQIRKSDVKLKPKYRMLFKAYQQSFKEDLYTLVKNPSFFIDNINELFVHYTFIAMTQIILQTNKFSAFSDEKLYPVAYILATEKASKWRLGYKEGFQRLKEQMTYFYTHEHMLNVLALNHFTEAENLYYHDYAQILEEAGEGAKEQYIQSIYEWVNTVYVEYQGLEPTQSYEGQDLDAAYRYMFDMIRKKLTKEMFSRFTLAFTTFITKFYRKNGGSLGTILSLNMKQLILMTALAVGQKQRIELNDLWKEFEKRGITFDDDSKLEIVTILDKLNYIDKKSDSGDAQYVKSIL